MNPLAERPREHHPPSSSVSAADEEDRLLLDLLAQVRLERGQLPALMRRIDRLRRLLKRSDDVVAQLRRELAQARRAEGCDPLTGLFNRRGFELPGRQLLAQHVGRPDKLALLFVDLDGFKAINDRFGHAVGDAVLQVVAARLAAGMRHSDLVCRHGGDEFVCLLANLDSEARAISLAAELLRALTQPCALAGHQVRVGASIGVALFPRDGANLSSLLRSADGAMYDAKELRCGLARVRSEVASA